MGGRRGTDTGDDLQIDFQWNGQAGDEALMVQKIRVGQLDGAIVSAMGLAQTGVTDALIFQLPGHIPRREPGRLRSRRRRR